MKEFHEIASIFPLLQGDEYETLKADIADNGLLEDIWLHPNGKIIDGRNRYRACLDIGIEPRFRTWNGQGSLVSFVVSLNLHRRHLTSSQRAAIGAKIKPLLAEEAKERQATSSPGVYGGKPLVEIFPQAVEKGKARDQAAAIAGTNGRYIDDVEKLGKEAPGLFETVLSGEFSIPEAKKLVELPEDERQEVIDQVRQGQEKTVSSAIRNRVPMENYRATIYEPHTKDRCQTPPYALKPLYQYLNPNQIIWEPAAGEGYIVKAFEESGFSVVDSDILTGQNFFEFEPSEWDILITNPPYHSGVLGQWIERCYSLGKPFALLMKLTTLGTKYGFDSFRKYGLEMIVFDKRISYKMPNMGWDGSGAQFASGWFTWGLNIGQQITFVELEIDAKAT